MINLPKLRYLPVIAPFILEMLTFVFFSLMMNGGAFYRLIRFDFHWSRIEVMKIVFIQKINGDFKRFHRISILQWLSGMELTAEVFPS